MKIGIGLLAIFSWNVAFAEPILPEPTVISVKSSERTQQDGVLEVEVQFDRPLAPQEQVKGSNITFVLLDEEGNPTEHELDMEFENASLKSPSQMDIVVQR